MKGFALNNPRKRKKASNGYQVSYVKIFNAKRFIKKHSAQKKHPMQANLTETIERLTSYLKETYESSEQSEDKLQVKKAQLIWSTSKKMKNHMDKLIRIFHVALIVTDYVFDFTRNNKKRELIPFCAEMLKNITTHSVFWSSMEKYLRFFDSELAKKTKAKTIDSIRQFPSSFRNHLNEGSLIHPEIYRDSLVKKMDEVFRRRRNYYWEGCIQEKDMYIVRFYVLNHQYKQVDTKKLLFLKHASKIEKD